MEGQNFIVVKMVEVEENGKHEHKIEVDARWSDSHHFLDMIAAAMETWRNREH